MVRLAQASGSQLQRLVGRRAGFGFSWRLRGRAKDQPEHVRHVRLSGQHRFPGHVVPSERPVCRRLGDLFSLEPEVHDVPSERWVDSEGPAGLRQVDRLEMARRQPFCAIRARRSFPRTERVFLSGRYGYELTAHRAKGPVCPIQRRGSSRLPEQIHAIPRR
jgi:hypothetical protein